MTKKNHNIQYAAYSSKTELPESFAKLLNKAIDFLPNAYAPYSKFHVSAAALLSNGEIVCGTNQENASYPIVICAERTLLSTIANIYAGQKIEAMAISYVNTKNDFSNVPATPCGMCRQALAEWTMRQETNFSLILGGKTGEVFVFDNAVDLLPFGFDKSMLEE